MAEQDSKAIDEGNEVRKCGLQRHHIPVEKGMEYRRNNHKENRGKVH